MLVPATIDTTATTYIALGAGCFKFSVPPVSGLQILVSALLSPVVSSLCHYLSSQHLSNYAHIIAHRCLHSNRNRCHSGPARTAHSRGLNISCVSRQYLKRAYGCILLTLWCHAVVRASRGWTVVRSSHAEACSAQGRRCFQSSTVSRREHPYCCMQVVAAGFPEQS